MSAVEENAAGKEHHNVNKEIKEIPPGKMILGPGIEGAVSGAEGGTSRPSGEQAPTRVSGSPREQQRGR